MQEKRPTVQAKAAERRVDLIKAQRIANKARTSAREKQMEERLRAVPMKAAERMGWASNVQS